MNEDGNLDNQLTIGVINQGCNAHYTLENTIVGWIKYIEQ